MFFFLREGKKRLTITSNTFNIKEKEVFVMKRISLILCMIILSALCFAVPAGAWGETSVSVPEGAYAGLECIYVVKPGIYDNRGTNEITVNITKNGKSVKSETVEYTQTEFNKGKTFTFVPKTTGKYTITATTTSGSPGSVDVTVQSKSKLKAFSYGLNNREVVFTGSEIGAWFNWEKFTMLDSHKCKVKVQLKKGKKVVKTKTFTEPKTTSDEFTYGRSADFKVSSAGAYTIVLTHYIDGKACYSRSLKAKVISKKSITGLTPELFMNFDQQEKTYSVFEDKICSSGVYGYKIYRSTKKSSGYKLIKTVTKPNYEIYKGKLTSKKYYYKIKVMTKVGKKKYTSKYSNIVKTPATVSAPTVNNITSDNWGKVTLDLKKISGATIYYVYWKKDGGEYGLPFTSGTNVATNYFTEAGKYTFKVNAYIHKEHYNIFTKNAYKTYTLEK